MRVRRLADAMRRGGRGCAHSVASGKSSVITGMRTAMHGVPLQAAKKADASSTPEVARYDEDVPQILRVVGARQRLRQVAVVALQL